MVEIQTRDRLLAAIRNTEKPVSFLVGAPFSWDGMAGVPPVAEMIGLVRDEIRRRDSLSLEGFDQAVGEPRAPDAYQKAMSFVQGCFDPEFVGQVVRNAVLKARRAGAPAFDFPDIGEGRHSDWHMPAGVSGMARLIKSLPEKFSGPILTTNFDPMIRLAFDAAGLRSRCSVMPTDGSIDISPRNHADEIDVLHLHGYWRNSPTLHTASQLTSSRPQLQQSLQRLLRKRTLVVVAYGGWDDVISTALANCFNDMQFEGSIRWCFYSDDESAVRVQNQALFDKFAPGINTGRIQFYRGIDCHVIFDKMLQGSGILPNVVTATQASPLAGWDLLGTEYLNGFEPLRGEEAVKFFDGAVPSWRHAVSALIPRLSHVDWLKERLGQGLADTGASALQLIRAAGGEGKSTTLMQAAADAARGGDWSVLWRPSPELGLNPDIIAALPPSQKWLIVADDAETLLGDLFLAVQRLHQLGRSNVFFLIACRDADWRGANGDKMRWENYLQKYDDLILRSVSLDDARLVVGAWKVQGQKGLRGLAGLADDEARAQALRDAADGQDTRRGDGSFIGGLLAVRLDDAGLRAHIRELLGQLLELPVEGGTGTLFDALLFAAACHAVGIPGVDKNVLADLTGVPREWVISRVVRALGAECGAVHASGHVMTRHSRVAKAIIVEAEDHWSVDLGEVWAQLVRVTAKCGREGSVGHQSHGPILHAGPRLLRDLPGTLSKDRRKAIAIAAAEAATEHQAEWLGCVVDLGKTQRFGGNAKAAAEVFRQNIRQVCGKVDFTRVIRGFYFEWCTCEGNVEG